MKTTKIIHFFTLTFLIMLSACVGKIEEASVPVNSQFQPEPVYFNYRGIETALPIAHDKIELSFARVVGDTNDIVYKLYINDATNPITLGIENLTGHFDGRLYYIVKGLNINTLYNFKIRAFKISEGAESKSENTKQARTYNNIVADFSGVANLAQVPGLEDKAIEVSWDRVPYIFGLIPSKKDPVKYLISYSPVSPDDLFNPASLTRKEIPADTQLPATHPSSTIISNLLPNQLYFFAVRAIHKGYQDYTDQGASYIPIDKERNTKFLSLRTSRTLDWTGNISTNSQVQNAKGEPGYRNISVSWDRATGSYSGYKILYRKFTEYDNTPGSLANFQITNPVVRDVIAQGSNNSDKGIINCTNCPGGNTQTQITGLTPGAWYHIKVFICEGTDTSCPLIKPDSTEDDPNDNLLAKSFNQLTIQVKPSLSSFMGINSIKNPTSDLADDEVILEFSPPDTTNGWADTMNFYCVDNSTQYLITGTSIQTALQDAGRCTGIYRAGFSNSSISSMTSLSIRGTQLNNEYTFTASPEYNKPPFNGNSAVTYPPLERIKRTISPEIIGPTISEFTGLNKCSVNAVTKSITGNWTAPTGGIYQDYVFFWKEKSASSPFNLTTAMAQYKTRVDGAGPTDYTGCTGEVYCHKKISKGIFTSSTPGLKHGTYELAVQTLFKKNSYYKWSQPNTNVKRCEIKIPRATFQEWTRIFAIGPKENHLNQGNNKYTREGLLWTGIPWEIGTNTVVDRFFRPPGEKLTETQPGGPGSPYTIELDQEFDGAKSKKNPGLGSNTGIISIAWTNFSLDNSLDSADWISESITTRSLRKNGYKVYRSKDNRISWEDLTVENLIYAQPYSNYPYRHRPNVPITPPTTRMAFFTDYSVINLEKDLNGIEQARVYWYKIVPIFNGSPMEVMNPQAAMIKVTLPPPNMALVHRWMANRAQCLELGLTPIPNNNYSCNFTGLGAVPKTVPFGKYKTKIDLKGDLLIDRFELGCNYTRGDVNNQVVPGYTDEGNFSQGSFNRQGCYKVNSPSNDFFTAQVNNPLPGLLLGTATSSSPPDPLPTNFNSYLLVGDCIGNSAINHPFDICSEDLATRTNNTGYSRLFSSPGYQNSEQFNTLNNSGLCTNTSIKTKMTDPSWVKISLAQSKFGAVYHNTSTSANLASPVVYNNAGTITANHSWHYSASCSINLAAINGGEYFPRWVDLNSLNGRFHSSVTLDKTPQQLLAEDSINLLYDNTNLTKPSLPPPESPESIASKKLGLILTTNKAGTPPLMFVERDTGKKVCNLYQVRQAFQSKDDGNGFPSQIGSLKNKRLLRKREFVASNLWPETYTNDDIDFLEGVKITTTNPVSLSDPSNEGKGCVNTKTLNSSAVLTRWNQIPERIRSGHPHLSGSTTNSQCTSRFGIQDLIGNQKETSSEVLFCDYAPIELWWGQCTGTRQDNGKCDILSNDPHVVLNSNDFNGSSNQEVSNYYILSNGTPINSSTTLASFTIKNESAQGQTGVNANSTKASNGTWGYDIVITGNAGYCSLADSASGRRDNAEFRWVQDYFTDFFFKTINQNLVTRTNDLINEDSGAPSTFRDGSGYFLDFGSGHMTAPLTFNDSIALPWSFTNSEPRSKIPRPSPENYPMISTLLGIPLICGSDYNGVWNEACTEHDVAVMDEKTHEMVLLRAIQTGQPFEFPNSTDPDRDGDDESYSVAQDFKEINNFYTGGSQFKSKGLAGINSSSISVSSNSGQNYPDLLSGFTYKADGTTEVLTSNQIDYTSLTLFHLQWNVSRGTKMYFTQGGHFNNDPINAYNGRFSTEVESASIPQVESGVRCGVMINEVD